MTAETPPYHREYLVSASLPLAQLYIRAFNAKDSRGRHDNCFYLFECMIKLAACPLIASYLAEVRQGGERDEKLDRLLAQIALPSLGQWLGFLRETSRHVAKRPDAATHPLGHVWDQLNQKRSDLAGTVDLFRRIKNGPQGKVSGAKSVSLLELFGSLVQYRNAVFGHGATRHEAFYENEMGPLLLRAVNDVVGEDVLRWLGPDGSRLIYVREVRRVSKETVQVDAVDLTGLHSGRLDPIAIPISSAAHVLPNQVCLQWPGSPVLLDLDPLLVYREDGLTEEVLLLNRDRNAKHVEYLSYTTGQTNRTRETTAAMQQLLETITGKEISQDHLNDIEESVREIDGISLPHDSSQGSSDDSKFEGSDQLRISDFEIFGQLGQGSMGVVYLAGQHSLGRTVALKMLTRNLTNDATAQARFHREIKALAQSDHPNIVKILCSGRTPTGQLYYAMEYVSGSSLDAIWTELQQTRKMSVTTLNGATWAKGVIRAGRKTADDSFERKVSDAKKEILEAATQSASLDDSVDVSEDSIEDLSSSSYNDISSLAGGMIYTAPRVPSLAEIADEDESYDRCVARVIRDAARALQVVHDQNIIHRDIKPSNLAVTFDASRIVLMDFGLAKGNNLGTATATRDSGFLGTLRYAAPEQFATSTLEVGPPADVRALGVTMWEMLTRRRLFEDSQDEAQLALSVHQKDVPLLRTVDESFPKDLEAIVSRATERTISDRIPTAAALADHLDEFLDGRPVTLRSRSLVERFGRGLREQKVLALAASFALVVLVVSFIVWRQYDHLGTMQVYEIEPPLGLEAAPVPSDNLMTRARVELGKQLFFDKRLSANDDMACVTCHDPAHGYSVPRPIKGFLKGHAVSRSAQTLVNVSYHQTLFWDGRADNLEMHALMPILNPHEMAMPSAKILEEKLHRIPGYVSAFRETFESEIKADDIARAIAAFERTLLAGDSPYDRFKAGDNSALSDSAKRGMDVFFHKATCHSCHKGSMFSDGEYHNIGVDFGKEDRDAGRSRFEPDEYLKELSRHSFRTPPLRDIVRTPPYMHNGSLKTLADVVEYYDRGGTADPEKDPRMKPLKLTAAEKTDLVEFLAVGLKSHSYPRTEPPELPADGS